MNDNKEGQQSTAGVEPVASMDESMMQPESSAVIRQRASGALVAAASVVGLVWSL